MCIRQVRRARRRGVASRAGRPGGQMDNQHKFGNLTLQVVRRLRARARRGRAERRRRRRRRRPARQRFADTPKTRDARLSQQRMVRAHRRRRRRAYRRTRRSRPARWRGASPLSDRTPQHTAQETDEPRAATGDNSNNKRVTFARVPCRCAVAAEFFPVVPSARRALARSRAAPRTPSPSRRRRRTSRTPAVLCRRATSATCVRARRRRRRRRRRRSA